MRVPDGEQVDRLTKALGAGTPAKDACLYAGILFEDYNEWRARGKKHQVALAAPDQETVEVLDADVEERPYLTFLVETDKAIATAKVQCTVAISGGIRSGDWRAAAWLLERTDPENFGRRMLQPVNQDGSLLPTDVDPMVARLSEDVRRYRAEHLELGTGDIDDDDVVEAEIVAE